MKLHKKIINSESNTKEKMGCCQGRDDKIMSKHPPKAVQNTDLNATTSISISSDQAPPPKLFLNSQSLKTYIETLTKLNQWERIVSLIKDDTPIQDCPIKLTWAESPKTIGSYILLYLCKCIQENNSDLQLYLQKELRQLFEFIKSRSDDLRDHSLLLLYYFLDNATNEDIQTLMELNIFRALMRLMMCSIEDLRHITAGICYKLYKGRQEIRTLFLAMKGGKNLMQQISWSSDNEEVLKSLLEYLLELLEDEEGKVFEENIKIINEEQAGDILRDISASAESADTIELMDLVISLLSYEESF